MQKYKQEFVKQAYKLCLIGAIDVEVADFFGVTEMTLNRWKKKYPDFNEALQAGKMTANERVVNALFTRATGTIYEEKTTTIKPVYNEAKQQVENHEEVRIIKKLVAPDTKACIYWLNNRDPKHWSNKHMFEIGAAPKLPNTKIVTPKPKKKLTK